jgi:alpha-galactosidase/6-phospho-beta-glucosidase family protein
MYVGSTIDLTKRKNSHKSACNNPNSKDYNLLVYTIIRENGGWTNWRMLEIEHKIVKDKTEAKQQEQYWIEFYNSQMNMIKATYNQRENQREYYKQNKEQLIANQRIYREKNKEQIKANQRK